MKIMNSKNLNSTLRVESIYTTRRDTRERHKTENECGGFEGHAGGEGLAKVVAADIIMVPTKQLSNNLS